jgi:hypothetical protein
VPFVHALAAFDTSEQAQRTPIIAFGAALGAIELAGLIMAAVGTGRRREVVDLGAGVHLRVHASATGARLALTW